MQTGKLWTAAGGFNIERSSPLKLIDNANRDAPRHTVYPALPRHCAQRRSRSAAARRSSCDSRTNKPLEDSWRRHHGTRTVVVAGERLHVYVTFVMAWGVAHNRPFPDVLFPEGWFIYTWLAVYAATGWGTHRRSWSGCRRHGSRMARNNRPVERASRTMAKRKKLRVGSRVVLVALPPGLVDGLPAESCSCPLSAGDTAR